MTDTKLDAGIYSAALDERDALRAEVERLKKESENYKLDFFEARAEVERLEATDANMADRILELTKERDALGAENARIQAANDTLRVTLNSLGSAHAEAQHDLAEARRALDEARKASRPDMGRTTVLAPLFAQPSVVSRRDMYICAILGGPRGDENIKNVLRDAAEIMAAADREVPK
jgi:multidrug resistance efflux pump